MRKFAIFLMALFLPFAAFACPDENGSCETYSITLNTNGGTTEYTELSYLTSTGVEYIDTGIQFELAYDFIVSGNFINPATVRKVIIGSFCKNNEVAFNIELTNVGQLRNFVATGAGNSRDVSSKIKLPTNTLISYNVYYNATEHKITNYLEYNGSTQHYDVSSVISGPDNNLVNLKMFLDNRTGNMYGIDQPVSIGTTRFYKAGVLVGNFIPVRRNSDNVLGFYDTVTGTFKTNGSGTGAFVAGPDVGPFPANYIHDVVGAMVANNLTHPHGTFVAWCDDSNLTTNCTTTKSIAASATGNKTLYAKWQCDAGYGNHNGSCLPLCTAGITKFHVGNGVSFNLYRDRITAPSFNVMYNNTVCYVGVETGRGQLNFSDGTNIWHATY